MPQSDDQKLIPKLRVALAVWLIAIVVLSILPLSFKLRLHTIGTLHDLGHYFVYITTGVLLWFSAERFLPRALGFLMGLSVALVQEWLENRLYHAGFEWKDVRTDLAGLATGFALMFMISALAGSVSESKQAEG